MARRGGETGAPGGGAQRLSGLGARPNQVNACPGRPWGTTEPLPKDLGFSGDREELQRPGGASCSDQGLAVGEASSDSGGIRGFEDGF